MSALRQIHSVNKIFRLLACHFQIITTKSEKFISLLTVIGCASRQFKMSCTYHFKFSSDHEQQESRASTKEYTMGIAISGFNTHRSAKSSNGNSYISPCVPHKSKFNISFSQVINHDQSTPSKPRNQNLTQHSCIRSAN